MKVLIAPDKFKGSISSTRAAAAIARGWQRAWPACKLISAPIADGGEGFAEAFHHGGGGEWISLSVQDALGRLIAARYLWLPQRRRAVIEMSEASGLWRLTDAERDPMSAHTFGTGEMIRDAVSRGAREILVGLGGSATTDGGLGLAAALGHVFRDSAGLPLSPHPRHLSAIASIDSCAALPLPILIAACDVENPLLGPRGTAHVFAAQKGADSSMIAELERGLTHFADIVEQSRGGSFRDQPGAGAAGGLGFGLLAFGRAVLRSGFDLVSEALDLKKRIQEADLILTAEGRLDSQTLEGKGPSGVAALARAAGRPVLAFCGSVLEEERVSARFDGVCPIVPGPLSLDAALAQGESLLEQAATRAARLLQAGANLPRPVSTVA